MSTPSESAEIYCLKCRAKTQSSDVESVVMKNGRPALKAVCAECGTGKYRIGSTG
jgi:RNase P subunit RPR2